MPDIDIVALGEPWSNSTRPAPASRNTSRASAATPPTPSSPPPARARCAYLTRVGGDSFGAQLLELWKAEGVDTSGVEVDPDAHTGLSCSTARRAIPSATCGAIPPPAA